MDYQTVTSIAIAIAGTLGGYAGGRRNSTMASDTISMLSAQVNIMREQVDQLPGLRSRIAVLEELVTQRADVEAVKEIVTRIEEKINESSRSA